MDKEKLIEYLRGTVKENRNKAISNLISALSIYNKYINVDELHVARIDILLSVTKELNNYADITNNLIRIIEEGYFDHEDNE